MSKSPSDRDVHGLRVPEEAATGDLEQAPGRLHEVQETGLPRYRVELESTDGRTRRVTYAHAGSMGEALVKVREEGVRLHCPVESRSELRDLRTRPREGIGRPG